MTTRASGTFEVRLTPRDLGGPSAERGVASMSIDKTFEGDLEGSSVGEMLAFRTAHEGSAGYVAEELVTGTLEGRSGSFVLQHSCTMNRGEQQQSIEVVPDSGTGELEGLSGSLWITIEDGRHSYDFDYTLA